MGLIEIVALKCFSYILIEMNQRALTSYISNWLELTPFLILNILVTSQTGFKDL